MRFLLRVAVGPEVAVYTERHPTDEGKATDEEGVPDSCEMPECVV